MFLALVLAAAPVPPMVVADWKPTIKARTFAFEADHSGALNSVAAAKKAGLTAEYQPSPNGFGEGTFAFQKKDGPKVTLSGHSGTPVVVRGDVLYVGISARLPTAAR